MSKSPIFVQPSASVIAAGAKGAFQRLAQGQSFGKVFVLCLHGQAVASGAGCGLRGCAA